nr:hypothetical protein CFP56_60612 [Quercus suber]
MANGGSKGGVGTSDANRSRSDLAHQGKKKGRGPRNLKLAKEFKGGERYEIGWLNGRLVGPHARDLINECTKLVRAQQNVPIKFTNWKKVPYINKRKLFDKVLDMYLQNKENRDKNNIVHTSGSKSFQQRSAEEKERIGHSPNRIELFDITHMQANGQVVNEPTQDALVALRNLTTQMNEGALQISRDQMFVEVFGLERHGRVRAYGAGVTPTKLWGSSLSRMYDLGQ